ncbi:MAG TPA: TonB family protein [Terriglobales bacterium]|nr:TonB family protein [Terriglobales bacterium]
MSTVVVPEFPQQTVSERRLPRYKLAIPLDLTVLRSGVPDKISGNTIEIGEGGMGVVAASELLVGESVRVEFLVPHMSSPVRATAVVRYQRDKCFGLQFLRLPVAQQLRIRYWTRHQGEILLAAQPGTTLGCEAPKPELSRDSENSRDAKHQFRSRSIVSCAVCVLLAAALLGWWTWQRGWQELEARAAAEGSAITQPRLKVPADTMERRIIHQVTPEYPALAQQARVHGTVVLNTVINAEGAVTQVKLVSGPQALSQAAMDAVRWWRYEPYVVNGQPATVETTVSVNFRLAN